jgi:acyl-[acyl-carrier-protein]-phospholipid O-acyltransferase/long-chain-fatty-acid--[acyl-carrier-protein] ligase
MPGGKAVPTEEARQAWANASRIFDTSLLHEDDLLLVLLKEGHPLAATFLAAVPKLRRLACTTDVAEAEKQKSAGRRVVAVGDSALRASAKAGVWDFAVELIEVGVAREHGLSTGSPAPDLAVSAPALYDAATGALLTLSVPNPKMPPNEEDLQHGLLPGTFGHILPALAVRQDADTLIFNKLAAGSTTEIRLSGLALDAEGFIIVAAPAPASRVAGRTS